MHTWKVSVNRSSSLWSPAAAYLLSVASEQNLLCYCAVLWALQMFWSIWRIHSILWVHPFLSDCRQVSDNSVKSFYLWWALVVNGKSWSFTYEFIKFHQYL